MRKAKLQTRFFLSYLSLVLVVEIILSVFFYQYTSGILITRETQNIVNLTSTFQTQTDQAVKVMDNISINVGYSNLLKDSLEAHFASTKDTTSDKITLAGLISAINGTDSQVDQINIYDFSGEVVGFGRLTVDKTVNLLELDWYEPTLELNGLKYLPMPYYSDAFSSTIKNQQPYFSLFRTYFNKFGRQVGIIEAIQSYNTIFKSINTYAKKNDNAPLIYVYNETGNLIYPFPNPADAPPLDVKTKPPEQLGDSYFYESLKDSTNQFSITNPDTHQKELVAYQKSSYSGWVYITVQPEKTVLAPVYKLSLLLATVVFITLLGTSIVAYFVARSLSNPIKRLCNIIRKTELSTLGETREMHFHTSIDELEELNRAFQNMSTDLKTSMDELIETKQQEMKSRSLALQSQINPHFYYNSLSSIIILAEKNQPDEVVNLCRKLSQIMRYITDSSTVQVTIREELDYIAKYMYCMKIRYRSSLNYSIDVDDSLMDLLVPKLIIQPLVENALKYGTDCIPPWNISISCEIGDDYWRIDVQDSGSGFSHESLQLIDSRIKLINQTSGLPEMSIDGMGLLNVYSRWKLYAGNACIFTCKNRPAGGACVSIGQYVRSPADLTAKDQPRHKGIAE